MAIEDFDLTGIVEPLLAWYGANARDLPWRRDRDPYRVWVSEIMLQQTQVETALPYYQRFLAALPDIGSLARAEEGRLLKLWQGLGYYSRARHLRQAAQAIMAEHGGVFPREYTAIRALPGIGDYTAGAIASICFGQPRPAVDGNVLRLLARLGNDGGDIASPAMKRKIAGALADIYPQERAGDFTQALMELGALVCLPQATPGCQSCPLASLCLARRAGRQAELPIKAKARPRRKQEMTVFLLLAGERVAIRQRPAQGLLGRLWEFPHEPGRLEQAAVPARLEAWGIDARHIQSGPGHKHVFTHVEWLMDSYVVRCAGPVPGFTWASLDQLQGELALPGAFHPFLRAILAK